MKNISFVTLFGLIISAFILVACGSNPTPSTTTSEKTLEIKITTTSEDSTSTPVSVPTATAVPPQPSATPTAPPEPTAIPTATLTPWDSTSIEHEMSAEWASLIPPADKLPFLFFTIVIRGAPKDREVFGTGGGFVLQGTDVRKKLERLAKEGFLGQEYADNAATIARKYRILVIRDTSIHDDYLETFVTTPESQAQLRYFTRITTVPVDGYLANNPHRDIYYLAPVEASAYIWGFYHIDNGRIGGLMRFNGY